MSKQASTYYEYVFGFASDIYELLEKGYGHYNMIEFMQLLNQAREEHNRIKEENERHKNEIAIKNANIIASLEKDLLHMKMQANSVLKPKYNIMRTVEQLDP